MDITNPVIQLCLQGSRAEFEHRPEDARALYRQAWEAHRDDYEACIAAHYLARSHDKPEEVLRWNELALEHAQAVKDEKVAAFYPSLYLNLGSAHEKLGNQIEAQRYYQLAAGLGSSISRIEPPQPSANRFAREFIIFPLVDAAQTRAGVAQAVGFRGYASRERNAFPADRGNVG
jgi:hypothetical protein